MSTLAIASAVPFALQGGIARAIAALFAASEKGVWYDPSDLSTIFQDSVGTTAGVVGQPVGLMLDKSNGLVLGPELVTNGTFDTNTTGWSGVSGATLAVSNNALVATNTLATVGKAEQTLTTVVGKTYEISGVMWADANNSVANSCRFNINTTVNVWFYVSSNGVQKTLSARFVATSTSTLLSLQIASSGTAGAIGDKAYLDNISVRELPGYHAIQATSTARGVLGASLVDLDGVDDSVSIATGAGGGSTGFFLCAAVRPDGGAGANRVIYSDAGTNTGYIVRLNTSNQLELAAGNGTTYTLAAATDTLTVGTTYLVTAWDDGTNLNVQVNSGTVGTAARPVVSAGNADARIGKDYGAATGWFNGAIYPLVYVRNGENVDSADRAAVKAYVAGKAGVSL